MRSHLRASLLALVTLLATFTVPLAAPADDAPAAPPPAAKAEKPARPARPAPTNRAEQFRPKSPIAIECSKQADAKGLHGKERQKFREKCKAGKA